MSAAIPGGTIPGIGDTISNGALNTFYTNFTELNAVLPTYSDLDYTQLNVSLGGTYNFSDSLYMMAKAQYEKNLELVDAKRKEAWANLSRMKSAGDDTWEKIRIQMDKSWEDFKNSVDQLTALSKK